MNNSQNIKAYNKLIKEIDQILDSKRISYALFSQTLGIQAVNFYNRYKTYGFSLPDLNQFLEIAKIQPPNLIRCIKCNKEFLPKAKSVKRAFCDDCKAEIKKKSDTNENLRFKYPAWITGMSNWEVRNLVEQEYHIDEETAQAMSTAATLEEARAIRSDRWKSSVQSTSSVVYDTLNVVKIL